MRKLSEKNTELVDLVKDWEKKYEEKVNNIAR